MTQDEIAVMDGGKCILQSREGSSAFFSDKFDITKHSPLQVPCRRRQEKYL